VKLQNIEARNVEAVLFDLDGLLADTEDLHLEAYFIMARKMGISPSREYLQSFFGAATRENVLRIMKKFNVKDYSFDEMLKLRFDSYHDLVKKSTLYPMEGAEACIENISQTDLKRALVTSSMKSHAVSVLENISKHFKNPRNLIDFFNATVFGNEIKNLKPEPDMYNEAAKRLDVKPEKCVVLEDSESGVIAAKKAGMSVIAVPNVHTGHQKFDLADVVVQSLLDVAGMEFMN
jgi:HAD superfamily hydrolase (TIGR01509 family)